MSEIRIIIAGSRTFNEYSVMKDAVKTYIDYLPIRDDNEHQIVIVSGGARGADLLGERFAMEYGYNLKRFKADWNNLGKRAGYVRNEDMAKFASEGKNGCLIAFWDGKSRGTEHMINLAQKYKLTSRVIIF